MKKNREKQDMCSIMNEQENAMADSGNGCCPKGRGGAGTKQQNVSMCWLTKSHFTVTADNDANP